MERESSSTWLRCVKRNTGVMVQNRTEVQFQQRRAPVDARARVQVFYDLPVGGGFTAQLACSFVMRLFTLQKTFVIH